MITNAAELSEIKIRLRATMGLYIIHIITRENQLVFTISYYENNFDYPVAYTDEPIDLKLARIAQFGV